MMLNEGNWNHDQIEQRKRNQTLEGEGRKWH